MRSLVLLLLLAPAAAADPAPGVDPGASAAPAPTRATPTPGPVPGMPSLVVTVKKDPTRCGGHAILITAKRGKPAAADADFIAAMTIDAPRGLDFEPAHETAAARSTKRFNDFIDDGTKKVAAVSARAAKTLTDAQAPAQDRVVAVARVAQAERRFADALATMEIPADMRTDAWSEELANNYCGKLADRVQPIDAKADEAAGACLELATNLQVGAGWWDAVCAKP